MGGKHSHIDGIKIVSHIVIAAATSSIVSQISVNFTKIHEHSIIMYNTSSVIVLEYIWITTTLCAIQWWKVSFLQYKVGHQGVLFLVYFRITMFSDLQNCELQKYKKLGWRAEGLIPLYTLQTERKVPFDKRILVQKSWTATHISTFKVLTSSMDHGERQLPVTPK